MVARLTEAPRTLSQVRPDIAWPNELEQVFGRALDRDASRRYPSVREFAHAFHAAIAMMPSATAAATRTARVASASSDAPTERLSAPVPEQRPAPKVAASPRARSRR